SNNYPSSCAKLTIFLLRIAASLATMKARKADSQTGTSCPVPDLWRGLGREMRTHHGTAPHPAASCPTLDCIGLTVPNGTSGPQWSAAVVMERYSGSDRYGGAAAHFSGRGSATATAAAGECICAEPTEGGREEQRRSKPQESGEGSEPKE